tara:strand:- start:2863 stop:3333 length:471 start_codon:yes stop_codon:yes gene_type:complete
MRKKYILSNIIIEDSIYLIGISSALDNYNLVYKLNKQLNLKFVRSKKDIDLPKEKAYYSHFIAKNKSKEIIYDFFSNKFKKISSPDKLNKLDLFNSHFSKEVYLLKEYKEADYFLKSTDQKYHQEIVNCIRNIPQISIIYNVNSNEIKNKENLIFN